MRASTGRQSFASKCGHIPRALALPVSASCFGPLLKQHRRPVCNSPTGLPFAPGKKLVVVGTDVDDINSFMQPGNYNSNNICPSGTCPPPSRPLDVSFLFLCLSPFGLCVSVLRDRRRKFYFFFPVFVRLRDRGSVLVLAWLHFALVVGSTRSFKPSV